MSDDSFTPLGEFSARVAQRRCLACGRITMQAQCPVCGQMLPRVESAGEDVTGWRETLRRLLGRKGKT